MPSIIQRTYWITTVIGAVAISTGAMGWVVLGPLGAVVAGIAPLLLLWCAGRGAEWFLSRFHRAKDEIPEGLERTLSAVLREEPGPVPRLRLIVDSSPNVMVARSLRGKGTILLTQGLLVALTEAELRAVLSVCVRRCREADLPWQSLCAVVASCLFMVAPKAWVHLLLSERPSGLSTTEFGKSRRLGVVSFLGFAMVLPLARFFVRAGGDRRVLRAEGKDALHYHPVGNDLESALRKIRRSGRTWAFMGALAGAPNLYLMTPSNYLVSEARER